MEENQFVQNSEQNYSEPQTDIPNATLILVLGIISIPACCCLDGVIGLILSIITVVLGKSAMRTYAANPLKYTESSHKNLKTGITCAWVGLALAIIMLIIAIILIGFIGFEALTNPELLQEKLMELQQQ